jgi:hypothetical protein
MTLVGKFSSRQDCVNNNGGQVERKGLDKDGIQIGYRCEMLLRL